MSKSLLLALALALPVLGQERKPMTDEQQLIQMERDLAQAALRGDVTLMDRYTAEDFLGVDPQGREVTKAQILARFGASGQEVESLGHEDIRVRVFGDCAVATARTVVKGRVQGQEFAGEYPYLRVWVKRQGRWQAVAAQSTSIAGGGK